MTKIDRIAIKLLPIVVVLIALVWAILSSTNPFVKKIIPTQRATYQNITKVEIDYPYSNASTVYTTEQHSKTIQAIIDDINSQSYGKWRESLGGKEAASAIGIHFYNNSDTPVVSFTLFPNHLSERGSNYRQLGIDGFHRKIDIRQLPALSAVWCDSQNTNDYNLSLRGKYCKD